MMTSVNPAGARPTEYLLGSDVDQMRPAMLYRHIECDIALRDMKDSRAVTAHVDHDTHLRFATRS